MGGHFLLSSNNQQTALFIELKFDSFLAMETRNLAAMALLNIYEKNNVSTDELLRGTGLNLKFLKQTSKTHRWDQFVRMYNNSARTFGPEKIVREIGFSGINNRDISPMIKAATGLFDVKSLFWAFSTFGCKHLFLDCVSFKYRKISSNHICMEIKIREDLQDCPLLLETYIYVFENIPLILGLHKAKVSAEFYEKRAIFNITFRYTSLLKLIFNRIKNFSLGYKSTIKILGEIENQTTELSKLVEEKSHLIRILSHDVANQVTIIDYYTNKVQKQNYLSESDKKSLEIAINGINSLKSILHNIQNMEVSNSKGLDLVPVDLYCVFESLKTNYALYADKKNIKIIIENEIGVGTKVLADKTSLEFNILGNLISNAIKFSPINSEVIIKANEHEDKILISVIDSGPGIEKQFHQTIFNEKIRTSHTGTAGEKGTGFGLGIVKNYLRLMGGEIYLHSNYPSGAIFTIELKLALPSILDNKIINLNFNNSSNIHN